MPTNALLSRAESYDSELSDCIDDLKRFNAGGTILRVDDDEHYKADISLTLPFSGYSPREDLIESLEQAIETLRTAGRSSPAHQEA